MGFTRFPVRQGTWYAEIEVVKLGKSQPCVGWGTLKGNPRKVDRIMVVGGKSNVKLDIGEGAPKKKKKDEEKKEEGEEKKEEGEDKKEGEEGDDKGGDGDDKKPDDAGTGADAESSKAKD